MRMRGLADRMGSEWPGIIWMIGVLVGIPMVIGVLLGASWSEIGLAFAVVLGLSAIMGLISGEKTWEMRATWAAIYFMIGALPGVPLVLVILRMVR